MDMSKRCTCMCAPGEHHWLETSTSERGVEVNTLKKSRSPSQWKSEWQTRECAWHARKPLSRSKMMHLACSQAVVKIENELLCSPSTFLSRPYAIAAAKRAVLGMSGQWHSKHRLPAQSISQKNEKIGMLLTECWSDVIALLILALISTP